MKLLKLIARNSMRHPLRTGLTILGLAITVTAFTLIRTTIAAWYAGAEASSPNRLVTRHAVSLTFEMPVAYRERILKVDGVNGAAAVNWFAGTYIEPRNFFAQFAVDPEIYFDLAPEFIVPPDQFEAFKSQRNSALVGRKLADRFGWEIGDPIRLTGTIYPGDWDFVIRGIYTGAEETTDENLWFHHNQYIDERLRQTMPGRAGYTGMFLIRIDDPSRAAAISAEIDTLFANSQAETLTETEEAFNLSFVAMGSQIVLGLQIISLLVVGVILLVLGNTMAMTARERITEYAVMKTLGFRPFHLAGLIFGESLFMGAVGGGLGLLVSVPMMLLMKTALEGFFPIYKIQPVTMAVAMAAALGVGLLAAVLPTSQAIRTSVVDGLRRID